VTSRVPFHVVSVYGVADARSSLWDRGMGGSNLRVVLCCEGRCSLCCPTVLGDRRYILSVRPLVLVG
jgi:hypothetical protein